MMFKQFVSSLLAAVAVTLSVHGIIAAEENTQGPYGGSEWQGSQIPSPVPTPTPTPSQPGSGLSGTSGSKTNNPISTPVSMQVVVTPGAADSTAEAVTAFTFEYRPKITSTISTISSSSTLPSDTTTNINNYPTSSSDFDVSSRQSSCGVALSVNSNLSTQTIGSISPNTPYSFTKPREGFWWLELTLSCFNQLIYTSRTNNPLDSLRLVNGDSIPSNLTSLTDKLTSLGYIGPDNRVVLNPNEVIFASNLDPQTFIRDYDDAIIRVILPPASNYGDVVLDETLGPNRFLVSRLSSHHRGQSSEFTLAYTQLDVVSNPAQPKELIKFCKLNDAQSAESGCQSVIIHQRSRTDPNARDIGALEVAMAQDGFYGLGWVEVTSTAINQQGAGQATLFKLFVTFTTDGGITWSTPQEVASFDYTNLGRYFVGGIKLAATDANTIGVLIPYDRVTTGATNWKLRGQNTSDALVLLEYTNLDLNNPRVVSVVSSGATIDFPTSSGTQNIVDMTSGYSGNYVVDTGWVEANPPHPVLHVYYSQAGSTKVYSWGMTANGSVPNLAPSQYITRTVPAPNTGFPYATNTYRNALLKVNGYSIENPPLTYGNANLYPLTNAAFGASSGNRGSDTVFGTELDNLNLEPRNIQMHMMNSAGVVRGPYRLDQDVMVGGTMLPYCGDVTDEACYEYPEAQYRQDDRGALVGSQYLTTSVRQLAVEESNVAVETISQVVLHRGDTYQGDFASVVGADRLGPVNNSTNETGWRRILHVNGVSWGTSASVWTAPVSGKVGSLRTTVTSYKNDNERCAAAPNIADLNWKVHFWPDLASFYASPTSGSISIPISDPSNPYYTVQYGIATQPGCSQPQPVIDVRFDLSDHNIIVSSGQEVVIAVTAEGSVSSHGSFFRMASAIPLGETDLYSEYGISGPVTNLLSYYLPSFPRFGGIITLVPLP